MIKAQPNVQPRPGDHIIACSDTLWKPDSTWHHAIYLGDVGKEEPVVIDSTGYVLYYTEFGAHHCPVYVVVFDDETNNKERRRQCLERALSMKNLSNDVDFARWCSGADDIILPDQSGFKF